MLDDKEYVQHLEIVPQSSPYEQYIVETYQDFVYDRPKLNIQNISSKFQSNTSIIHDSGNMCGNLRSLCISLFASK